MLNNCLMSCQEHTPICFKYAKTEVFLHQDRPNKTVTIFKVKETQLLVDLLQSARRYKLFIKMIKINGIKP